MQGRGALAPNGPDLAVDRCVNRLRPRAPLLGSPNPHPLFGFSDDWGAHLRARGTGYATGVIFRNRATGAELARTNMLWSAVQPHPAVRRWDDYDALNIRFQQMGVRPIWVVIGAPCWAQATCEGGGLAPPSPEHADNFGRFAAAVARRYPNSAGIEVWNEPNYPLFWGGFAPDPELYGAMLTAAASHVHAAAPGIPVVSAGLSPHSDGADAADGYREYLARLYELGAAQRADAIGIHPYPSAGPAGDWVADARTQIGRIQLEMGLAGHAAPLWVTEYGASTTGGDPFAPEVQGAVLTDLYALFRRIDGIDVVLIHRLVESPELGGREAGFGLLDPSLEPKPGFCSVIAVRERPC